MRIDPVLHRRDPVLAHALAGHGREWRPDLASRLDLMAQPTRGLPSVEVYATGHRLDWDTRAGRLAHSGKWDQRKGVWTIGFGMDPLPDSVAGALMGRSLAAILDVPGAQAYRIESVVNSPLVAQLTLARID